MKKRKKKKINKKKFFSRIFLLLVAFILINVIIKSLGEKQEKEISDSIIVNGQEITSDLVDKPYIDKDKVLYLSLEDVQKIFDSHIYYEDTSKKIITTSGTKVAAIDVENNIVELNTANLVLPAGILNHSGKFYLPVSEMENIYQIEAYVSENSAILSSMQEEFITIKTNKKVSLKEKASGFSKTVQKLAVGEEVIYLDEKDKKGWTRVLTYERQFWICQNQKARRKRSKKNLDE